MFDKIRNFVAYRKIKNFRKKFNVNKDFNVKIFDKKIAETADKINVEKLHKTGTLNKKNLGIAATFLHDNGGHSACVFNFVKSFYKDYNLKMFLVNKDATINKHCSKKIKNISGYAEIIGINAKRKNEINDIIDLYNEIVDAKIKVLFSFIHPGDVISAVVFCLLKKYTDIKIIFFNHMDHVPVLGMMFCDKILEFRPAMIEVTNKIRGYDNVIKINLQAVEALETIYYSNEDKIQKRKELGIGDDEYFTLTGCAGYKLFDEEGSSYFEMIRDLLKEEPKLKHVVITKPDVKQEKIFDKIFEDDKDLLNRLSIIAFNPDFDILFQSCDLFIDSFPQGSALTHIDMMRNKRPTVLKIDKENPQASFECYLPDDYEYAFDNAESMKKGILKLLKDKKGADKIVDKLYEHYLKNFEFYAVKEKYKNIIDEFMR